MPLIRYAENPDSLATLLRKVQAIAQINKENLEFIESRREEKATIKHQYSLELKEPSTKKKKTVQDDGNSNQEQPQADDDNQFCRLLDHRITRSVNDLVSTWNYNGEPLTSERIAFGQFINCTMRKYEDLGRLNSSFIELHELYSRILCEQPESLAAARGLLTNLERLHVAIGEIHMQTLDVKDPVIGNESTSQRIKALSRDLKMLDQELPRVNIFVNKNEMEDEESQIVEFKDFAAISCKNVLSHSSNALVFQTKSFSLESQVYLACTLFGENIITLWNLSTQTISSKLVGHVDTVYALVPYKQNGIQMIASGSKDKSIKLWNLENNSMEATLSGHAKSIVSLTTCRNEGKLYLLSGSDDKNILMWDLDTNVHIATLEGQASSVTSLVTYCFDSNPYLVSGGFDGKVKIWNLRTRALAKNLEGNGQQLRSLAVIPRKNKIMVARGYLDGFLDVWDSENNDSVALLSAAEALPITGLEVVHYNDKACLVSCHVEGVIKIWNLETNSVITSLNSCTSISSLAVFNNGDQPCLATGRADGKIQIWAE